MRAALFIFALLVASCGAPPASQNVEPEATPAAAAALEVRDGWARPTPGGVDVSGGYITIANATAAEDRLLSASSPRAARAEIHQMAMEGGVMSMRAVEGGLAVPADQTVTLAPGGLHIMFFGVTQPFTEGEAVPLTLTFANAGEVQTTLNVQREAPASAAPAGDHSGH